MEPSEVAEKRKSCAPVEMDELLPTEEVCELFNECPHHISEHMLFYCLSCDGPICQRCLVPDHLNHNVEDQQEIIRRQNVEISEQIQEMNKELQHCQESLELLGRKETEMRSSLDDERNKISTCVDDHIAKVRLEGKHLMDELKAFDTQQTFLYKIGKERENLQKKLDTVESISSTFRQQDDDELLQCYKKIMTQLDDLLCSDDDATGLGVTKPKVPRFLSMPLAATSTCIGDISVTEHIVAEDEEEDTYETIWDMRARSQKQSERKHDEFNADAPSVPPPGKQKTRNSYEWTIIGKSDSSNNLQEKSPDIKDLKSQESVNSDHMQVMENPGYLPVSPRQRSFHYLQFVNEFGRFTDASSIATGGAGIVAVCDRQTRQISIFGKEGFKYRQVTTLKSLQPRGVAVLYDGTVVVANGVNAEMFSPNHIYEVIPDFRSKDARRSRQVTFSGVGRLSTVGSEVDEALCKRNTIAECDPQTSMIGQEDSLYRKTVIHTATEEASDTLKPRKDIQSVAPFPGNNFLLGDVARRVITRHTSSGLLFDTIDVDIKPYVISAIDDQRIVISDHDSVLIKYTNGVSKVIPIGHVFGLCYLSRVGVGSLLVSKRKKGSFRGYVGHKGAIDNYDISDVNPTLICQPLIGLYKPGGLVPLPGDELAIADKKSVKIYRFV